MQAVKLLNLNLNDKFFKVMIIGKRICENPEATNTYISAIMTRHNSRKKKRYDNIGSFDRFVFFVIIQG